MLLGQRPRCWANIVAALIQRVLFAGKRQNAVYQADVKTAIINSDVKTRLPLFSVTFRGNEMNVEVDYSDFIITLMTAICPGIVCTKESVSVTLSGQ